MILLLIVKPGASPLRFALRPRSPDCALRRWISSSAFLSRAAPRAMASPIAVPSSLRRLDDLRLLEKLGQHAVAQDQRAHRVGVPGERHQSDHVARPAAKVFLVALDEVRQDPLDDLQPVELLAVVVHLRLHAAGVVHHRLDGDAFGGDLREHRPLARPGQGQDQQRQAQQPRDNQHRPQSQPPGDRAIPHVHQAGELHRGPALLAQHEVAHEGEHEKQQQGPGRVPLHLRHLRLGSSARVRRGPSHPPCVPRTWSARRSPSRGRTSAGSARSSARAWRT